MAEQGGRTGQRQVLWGWMDGVFKTRGGHLEADPWAYLKDRGDAGLCLWEVGDDPPRSSGSSPHCQRGRRARIKVTGFPAIRGESCASGRWQELEAQLAFSSASLCGWQEMQQK